MAEASGMALNLRSVGGGGNEPAAHRQPIARAYAVVILAALLALVILRQLFGNVRVEIGTRG